MPDHPRQRVLIWVCQVYGQFIMLGQPKTLLFQAFGVLRDVEKASRFQRFVYVEELLSLQQFLNTSCW